mmetsp:Transcript_42871/g.167526  ORF Transcript_42871/g.167526 Transcript_42871/m.167526 type:complete len:156 (+) Transcript_42871:1487-1954(+)
MVENGFANLERHIKNTIGFGVPVVVCINRFKNDTDREIETVVRLSKAAGAFDAVPAEHFSKGGAGAKALAEAVVRACEAEAGFKLLYPDEMGLEDKIRKLSCDFYGAGDVELSVMDKQFNTEARTCLTSPKPYSVMCHLFGLRMRRRPRLSSTTS